MREKDPKITQKVEGENGLTLYCPPWTAQIAFSKPRDISKITTDTTGPNWKQLRRKPSIFNVFIGTTTTLLGTISKMGEKEKSW